MAYTPPSGGNNPFWGTFGQGTNWRNQVNKAQPGPRLNPFWGTFGQGTDWRNQLNAQLAQHPHWGAGAAPRTNLNPAPSPTPTPTPTPTPGPASNAPDPNAGLDSTYWANVNKNTFDVGNQITGLNQQDAANLVAMQQALGNLAFQEPRDQLKALNDANARGALYSTVYGQDAADLATQYANQELAAQSTYGGQHADLTNRIAGLEGDIPLFNTQEGIASAARMAAIAAANPAAVVPKPIKPGPPGAAVAPGEVPAGTRIPTSQVTPGSARSLVNISYPTNLPPRRGGADYPTGPGFGTRISPSKVRAGTARSLVNMRFPTYGWKG